MSNGAYINLEPKGEELEVGVVYQGGFDPENLSHMAASILLKHLDAIAERKAEPEVVPMPDEQDALDVHRARMLQQGIILPAEQLG